ncbi:hypothetical protein FA13DRAFT_298571 [Coprinellus micaceus]|uniref:Uncharacterized protein n=1 Tax=Coprinellus micaceus TaxID=71717 RepID=A0A4Y7SDP4_COPMI|nr:hypothetical protein FA13DRAFT_298571 [Coprinellus micaceus]
MQPTRVERAERLYIELGSLSTRTRVPSEIVYLGHFLEGGDSAHWAWRARRRSGTSTLESRPLDGGLWSMPDDNITHTPLQVTSMADAYLFESGDLEGPMTPAAKNQFKGYHTFRGCAPSTRISRRRCTSTRSLAQGGLDLPSELSTNPLSGRDLLFSTP